MLRPTIYSVISSFHLFGQNWPLYNLLLPFFLLMIFWLSRPRRSRLIFHWWRLIFALEIVDDFTPHLNYFYLNGSSNSYIDFAKLNCNFHILLFIWSCRSRLLQYNNKNQVQFSFQFITKKFRKQNNQGLAYISRNCFTMIICLQFQSLLWYHTKYFSNSNFNMYSI